MVIHLIDTHAHLDGTEYADDLPAVVARAAEAGVGRIFVPAISMENLDRVVEVCRQYPGRLFPMIGLHPEDVRADYQTQLDRLRERLTEQADHSPFIAIGEIGLDYYWSREFENEQLDAFRQQVEWAVETRLPLMIHCRKAQNEMVKVLRQFGNRLPGGAFHCFTGNAIEAEELLQFDGFMLGIGGVSTFKKSPLPEVLPSVVPLDRIVLETDSPYMAPVPHRGQRNEPAFVLLVAQRLANAYGVSLEGLAQQTTRNAEKMFLNN